MVNNIWIYNIMEKTVNQFEATVARIVQEEFPQAVNRGLVTEYIPQGVHTADFPLSNGYKARVIEGRDGVYFNVFRGE